MARPALNKASLNRERDKLRTYQRFLPSLDLKRKQLLAELAKARQAMATAEANAARLLDETADRLPMAADERVALAGLVHVTGVDLAEENLMGVHLPILQGVRCRGASYGLMGRPAWVDAVVVAVQQLAEARVAARVASERVTRLHAAVRRITQRVNLFDKVLIPNTQKSIKTIEVALSDADRAAVVRAKIAKQKNAARADRSGSGPAAFAGPEGPQ